MDTTGRSELGLTCPFLTIMTAQFPTLEKSTPEEQTPPQYTIAETNILDGPKPELNPAQNPGPLIDDNTYTSPPPPFIPFHDHSNVCASPLVVGADGINDSRSVVVGEGLNNGEEIKSDAPLIKCLEDLNWCSWVEIEDNIDLLDRPWLLNTAQRKRLDFADGFEKGSYFDNLLPIICSGYTRADKILHCGNTNLGLYKVPCDQWSLCSKCAYMQGVKASEMYYGSFNKAQFYHVTLGFVGDIPFSSSNSQVPRLYWEENEAALKHLLDHDLIDGVYMSHELKIQSLLPLRVNPHSHAIVTATDFSPEVQEALSQMIAGEPGISLVPSIKVKLIDTHLYHDKVIRYLTKAIELKEPYDSAWIEHCATDRNAAREINLSMREFLDAQAAAFSNLIRVVRFGNVMPQRKEFIGVSKEVREANRKKRQKPHPLKNRSQTR